MGEICWISRLQVKIIDRTMLNLQGPSSPPKLTSPTPAALLFSSATSIAAAAGRRAAAVASAAASPSSASSPQLNRSLSPGPERVGTSAPPGERQVRCVEGYGNNLYIGGSDGVVEWWVCDGGMNASQVSRVLSSCAQTTGRRVDTTA